MSPAPPGLCAQMVALGGWGKPRPEEEEEEEGEPMKSQLLHHR